MQKFILAIGSLLALPVLAAAALAAEDDPKESDGQIYVIGSLGGQQYFDDTGHTGNDIGGFGSFALGYRLPGHLFRIEMEASGQSANNTQRGSGHLAIISWTPNIYLDIPTGTEFVPYAGGGVGGASIQNGSGGWGNPLYTFDLEAGLNYDISPEDTVGIAYRFQQVPQTDPSSGNANPINASIIRVTYRHAF